MRLFKIFGWQSLLVAGVILLAPGAGFAQVNQYSQYYNCFYLNSYTQFCEYVLGESNISINTSGQITVNAATDADWGVIINPGQCQDNSDGNPYACQAPSLPGPGATVQTAISPGGASSSASGTGGAQLTPALTAQASQAGTYTETSYHYASFYDGQGYNTVNLQTQQSQSYTPAPPTISSIYPDQWPVGTGTNITIYGANLPSNPSVSFAYSNGGGTDNYLTWIQGNATSSQITGTVQVDPSDPGGESVTVTVTGGSPGNGFGEGGSGNSESASGSGSVGAPAPSCPTTVTLVSNTSLALQGGISSTQNFPAYPTGFGSYVTLQVADPYGQDWEDVQITEKVTQSSSTCPAQTIACDTGGNTFVVGRAPSFGTSLYGITLQEFPTQNGFWDLHTSVGTADILTKLQQGDSCGVVCTQTYSCGSTQLKSTSGPGVFTVTRNATHTKINGTAVTVVTATVSEQ